MGVVGWVDMVEFGEGKDQSPQELEGVIQETGAKYPHPVLENIERLVFVFAKTMPEMPHEYTSRRKARDDEDYVALYDAVMNDGVIEWWGDGRNWRPARYLYPGDGWRYWSMSSWRSDAEGRHPLEISRHINRSSLAEGEKLRAAGLLRSDPPPPKPPRIKRRE